MMSVMTRIAAILWLLQAFWPMMSAEYDTLPAVIHAVLCVVVAMILGSKKTKQVYWGVTLFPTLIAGTGLYFAWVTHNETALMVTLGVVIEVLRIQLIAAPVIAGLIVLTKRILK